MKRALTSWMCRHACVHPPSQVMLIRLKSTWGGWSAEHECSLPPTPREMDSDMSCLNKKLKFWGSVTFGQLWNSWGWPRRGALKKQRCVCQPPALCPVSYSWISVAPPLPTPTSPTLAVWAERYFSYLAHFLLHPQLQVTNVNIPSVYSMMEFVYLFDCSLFWTKIFVSFYWNVHTVNVC